MKAVSRAKEATEQIEPIRLMIGCGRSAPEGWLGIDAKMGKDAAWLDFADDSVDEVHASHILEHFPHGQVEGVLREWVRVLKPGGRIRIAVPDFELIAQAYLAGKDIPAQGYVMGGQIDEHDFHKAIFDYEVLWDVMRTVGLRKIRRWPGVPGEASHLPISLNLEGEKARFSPQDLWEFGRKIHAAMSVPRLGFMDNYFCAFSGLMPNGIQISKSTGAFWGQGMEKAIDQILDDPSKEYVLAMDYDTVYTRSDVEELMILALENPDADAIAPIQASRMRSTPLFTLTDREGNRRDQVMAEEMVADLVPAHTAHFGLTLLRCDAIRSLDRPLFWGRPGPDNTWGPERVDDDIAFWERMRAAKRSIYIAPRVAVGHAELMIRWPGRDLQAIYQHPSEFWNHGRPEECWQ